MVNNYFKSSS